MPRDYQSPPQGPVIANTFMSKGVLYEARWVTCRKVNCSKCHIQGKFIPKHGPYWYMTFTNKGRTRRVYIGLNLDTTKFRHPNGQIDLAKIYSRAKKAPKTTLLNDNPPDQLEVFPDAPETETPPEIPEDFSEEPAQAYEHGENALLEYDDPSPDPIPLLCNVNSVKDDPTRQA